MTTVARRRVDVPGLAPQQERGASRSGRGVPAILQLAWSDGRIGLAMASAASAAFALLSAWITPRGPITTNEALLSMAAAFGFGMAAGLFLGRRWSAFIAPAVFLAVFELARLSTDGPTVDSVRLDSTYGIIAFVVGRGVHWLLVLPPMIVAAVYGVELAARLGRGSTRRLGRTSWTVAGVSTLAILALAAVLASPPSTAPVMGPDGRPLPGSVAELTSVSIGGHDQALMIRGRSTDSPVLLHLAGGPGGTDLGAMRADVGLEQNFVVVTWDQRGTGKSYGALDPVATFTLDQMVEDTLALTNYLRARFDEDRIYLTGNSWGSTLGVLAVQQHPELFHAFVGTGQMVSQSATDRMFWEDTISWADGAGETELAASLREQGAPPYANIAFYEQALSHEHDWNVYPEFDGDKEMPFNLFVPENSLMDQVNGLRAFLDSFYVMYPQLQQLDFRSTATSLDVPVYMVLGAHEARGRADPANEWFAMLEAPSKEKIIFEHSGHRPSFEEPGVFSALMARVLDETR